MGHAENEVMLGRGRAHCQRSLTAFQVSQHMSDQVDKPRPVRWPERAMMSHDACA
jgi:hypothetical protein